MAEKKDFFDKAEEKFAFGPVPEDYEGDFDESIFNDPEYDIEDLDFHAGILSRTESTCCVGISKLIAR